MGKAAVRISSNLTLARNIWGTFSKAARAGLKELIDAYGLSVAKGDLLLLGEKWYVTHTGLIRLAHRRRCVGINVQQVKAHCDPESRRWVFRSTVYKEVGSRGFVGYGDADPSNVSPLVRGAEMRVAETRAVNRALRKAYGIGLCSVEELGTFAPRCEEPRNGKPSHRFPISNGNGSSNGGPKLRDRLSLLIRKYDLDAAQVKRYAADFCGTEILRDASRNSVESFITTLEQQAATDRGALLCKLNSYPTEQEVHS